MRVCPGCRGEKGRDDTSDGDVRWIICATCGGLGEVDSPPEAEPVGPAPDVPYDPSQDWGEADEWILGLLPQAYEKAKARLGRGPDAFESLDIKHHPPRMERLFWMEELRFRGQRREYRIVLHRVHPVPETESPDFHSHDCPSGIQILSGRYEHQVGTETKRDLVVTHQGPRSSWAMLNPVACHSIRPLDNEPVLTLMVQDRLYPSDQRREPEVKPSGLEELSPKDKLRLWYDMCLVFGVETLF